MEKEAKKVYTLYSLSGELAESFEALEIDELVTHLKKFAHYGINGKFPTSFTVGKNTLKINDLEQNGYKFFENNTGGIIHYLQANVDKSWVGKPIKELVSYLKEINPDGFYSYFSTLPIIEPRLPTIIIEKTNEELKKDYLQDLSRDRLIKYFGGDETLNDTETLLAKVQDLHDNNADNLFDFYSTLLPHDGDIIIIYNGLHIRRNNGKLKLLDNMGKVTNLSPDNILFQRNHLRTLWDKKNTNKINLRFLDDSEELITDDFINNFCISPTIERSKILDKNSILNDNRNILNHTQGLFEKTLVVEDNISSEATIHNIKKGFYNEIFTNIFKPTVAKRVIAQIFFDNKNKNCVDNTITFLKHFKHLTPPHFDIMLLKQLIDIGGGVNINFDINNVGEKMRDSVDNSIKNALLRYLFPDISKILISDGKTPMHEAIDQAFLKEGNIDDNNIRYISFLAKTFDPYYTNNEEGEKHVAVSPMGYLEQKINESSGKKQKDLKNVKESIERIYQLFYMYTPTFSTNPTDIEFALEYNALPEVIEALFKKGAIITPECENSVIQLALHNNALPKTIEMLFKHGAKIDEKEAYNVIQTALQNNALPKTIEMLFEHGAKIDNSIIQDALKYLNTCLKNTSSTNTMRILFNNGLNTIETIKATLRYGVNTPNGMITELCHNGAKLDEMDDIVKFALHFLPTPKIIKELFDNGAKIGNIDNEFITSALHNVKVALEQGKSTATIGLLFENGLDAKITMQYALQLVCKKELPLKIIGELFDNGANIVAQDIGDDIIQDIFLSDNRSEIIKILLSRGIDPHFMNDDHPMKENLIILKKQIEEKANHVERFTTKLGIGEGKVGKTLDSFLDVKDTTTMSQLFPTLEQNQKRLNKLLFEKDLRTMPQWKGKAELKTVENNKIQITIFPEEGALAKVRGTTHDELIAILPAQKKNSEEDKSQIIMEIDQSKIDKFMSNLENKMSEEVERAYHLYT